MNEPLAQLYGGLPLQLLLGPGDVRATLLRIILGQGVVFNHGFGIGDVDDFFCQLFNSEFIGEAK